MANKINCWFSDVTERDMDLLFLEEFVSSKSFLQIFTGPAGITEANVVSVYSSQTDVSLGESDITVIIESNEELVGLLIEDKIDALAMPDQAGRYHKRGQKGIERGDYSRYFVYIVAPRKYMESNEEAKKYPYRIDYETILAYFENLNDNRSLFKAHQIKRAIEKQKKGYQVEKDQAVTNFWSKYSEYQKANYPAVDFVYNNEIKGARARWPRFRTAIDGLYMYHKTESGYLDLTFDNCVGKVAEIEKLLQNSLENYVDEGFSIHKTGKSAAVRLLVPVLDLHKPFEQQGNMVKDAFEAISKMTRLAQRLGVGAVMSLLSSN